MKWETLYCPNRSCHYYGRPFNQGLLVKNGSSHGKKQALCHSCGRRVSLTYVWVAFAPEWRLVVGFVVGPRTQAQANLLLERVGYVTDDHIPFFTSDPWPGYPTALLHADGEWYQPERQGKRGRYPAPRCRPPPNLLYAQVVKRREKGRVVEVTRKVVWGQADALQARLAASATSTTINTSFVERDNLAWREHHRRLARQTTALSKELPWMEKQL